MKKTAIFMVVTAVCLFMAFGMSGCSKQSPASTSQSVSRTDDAVSSVAPELNLATQDVLEGCTISEDEMTDIVEEYFRLFSEALTKSGTTELDYKNVDGHITVTVTETADGETKSWTPFEWDSAKEAYRYLYTQGQVDLNGAILVTQEDMAAS